MPAYLAVHLCAYIVAYTGEEFGEMDRMPLLLRSGPHSMLPIIAAWLTAPAYCMCSSMLCAPTGQPVPWCLPATTT